MPPEIPADIRFGPQSQLSTLGERNFELEGLMRTTYNNNIPRQQIPESRVSLRPPEHIVGNLHNRAESRDHIRLASDSSDLKRKRSVDDVNDGHVQDNQIDGNSTQQGNDHHLSEKDVHVDMDPTDGDFERSAEETQGKSMTKRTCVYTKGKAKGAYVLGTYIPYQPQGPANPLPGWPDIIQKTIVAGTNDAKPTMSLLELSENIRISYLAFDKTGDRSLRDSINHCIRRNPNRFVVIYVREIREFGIRDIVQPANEAEELEEVAPEAKMKESPLLETLTKANETWVSLVQSVILQDCAPQAPTMTANQIKDGIKRRYPSFKNTAYASYLDIGVLELLPPAIQADPAFLCVRRIGGTLAYGLTPVETRHFVYPTSQHDATATSYNNIMHQTDSSSDVAGDSRGNPVVLTDPGNAMQVEHHMMGYNGDDHSMITENGPHIDADDAPMLPNDQDESTMLPDMETVQGQVDPVDTNDGEIGAQDPSIIRLGTPEDEGNSAEMIRLQLQEDDMPAMLPEMGPEMADEPPMPDDGSFVPAFRGLSGRYDAGREYCCVS